VATRADLDQMYEPRIKQRVDEDGRNQSATEV